MNIFNTADLTQDQKEIMQKWISDYREIMTTKLSTQMVANPFAGYVCGCVIQKACGEMIRRHPGIKDVNDMEQIMKWVDQVAAEFTKEFFEKID